MNKRKLWIGVGLALVVLGVVGMGGLWANQQERDSRPHYEGDFEAELPGFVLPDLDGQERNSAEWQGKVVLVNFWATWCPPCRREMPHFVDAQIEYGAQGFQVIGVAVDNADMVRDFVDVYGINFPVLIGDVDAMNLSKRMGNRFGSLPYSALFNREGETVFVRAGALTKSELDEALKPLL